MKEITIKEITHNTKNATTERLLNSLENVNVVFKLDDRIKERGLTQKQLSSISGLRSAMLSEFSSGKNKLISIQQLVVLMTILRITDIRDLIDISFSEDQRDQFEKERIEWINTNKIPETVQDIILACLNV